MSRLRQMPEIFLRGALATETMKCLNHTQQHAVAQLVEYAQQHPRLAPSRAEFRKQLGRTIGGDYRDDQATADQEFQIAVWRAVVHLLYHRSYEFVCQGCFEGSYLTQRGKPTAINRRLPVCPNCGAVRILEAGDSQLKPGQIIHHERLQELLMALPIDARPPVGGSPIDAVPGARKVRNPAAVLRDPDQFQKYFSEFIWNYFRQILAENHIEQHHKTAKLETAAADFMAVYELQWILYKHGIKYHYCDKDAHKQHLLHLDTLCTPPAFSVDFSSLLHKYKSHGVAIQHDPSTIIVPVVPMAPLVNAFVARPSPVLVASSHECIGGQTDDPYILGYSEYRIARHPAREGEHVASIDTEDLVAAIYRSLPDSVQPVFSIMVGRDELAMQFQERYGERYKPSNIAKFLGITTKDVEHAKRVIAHNASALGMVGGLSEPEEWD